MASKKQNVKLEDLVKNLEKSFQHWQDIYEHGCYDPFWADGVNLNLVRNHILSYKKQIEELLEGKKIGQTTLFPSSYPDVYYKPTPEEVSYDYMAQPDKIRSRATEQLAMFEQDPNYCYIRDHYKEAFPNGETRATKEAGIYPGKYSRFTRLRLAVENDNLVNMRCFFRVPYEEQIKEIVDCANELRAYLSSDHSHDENEPILDEYYEDEYEEGFSIENASDENLEGLNVKDISSSSRASLDEQIGAAKIKAESQEKQSSKEIEEQLSLF